MSLGNGSRPPEAAYSEWVCLACSNAKSTYDQRMSFYEVCLILCWRSLDTWKDSCFPKFGICKIQEEECVRKSRMSPFQNIRLSSKVVMLTEAHHWKFPGGLELTLGKRRKPTFTCLILHWLQKSADGYSGVLSQLDVVSDCKKQVQAH